MARHLHAGSLPDLLPKAWDDLAHHSAMLVGFTNRTFRAVTWKVPAMLIPSLKTPCWKEREESPQPPLYCVLHAYLSGF